LFQCRCHCSFIPDPIVKQPKARDSAFSRRIFARVMQKLCAPTKRGRRESRVLAAPAASRAK
jgi:hypothetical protein